MKIAIIGAGWVGCHLFTAIRQTISDKIDSLVLYDREGIFPTSSSSYINQNRLHKGYHYPRSSKTRHLCHSTFDRFLQEYGFLVKDVPSNLYMVSDKSIIDGDTYKTIYAIDERIREPYCATRVDIPAGFFNIDACFSVEEKFIDFGEAHRYFNNTIPPQNFVKSTFSDYTDIDRLLLEYDIVINCTNNMVDPIIDSYQESCLTHIIQSKSDGLGFGAVTLMDGDFFSIYPYDITNSMYTLTHVKYTPEKNSTSFTESYEMTRKSVIEYFPDYDSLFRYKYTLRSTKSKFYTTTDNRHPIVVSNDGRYIRVFTGKIQGIYPIADQILKQYLTAC